MKLNRMKKGYCFETPFAAVGKHFDKGYFVTFVYPWVGYGTDVYNSATTKPKFRNLMALSALFFIPYICMAIFGILWMVLYTAYTVFGVANLVNGIQESRQLGGFINLVSIFCVVFFYLSGVVAVIRFLIW